jgi:hypothetical protein
MKQGDETGALRRALQAFDIAAFVRKHGGYKESASKYSCEYLVTCPHCSSDRCRWRHGRNEREGTFGAKWVCWSCGRSGNSIDLIASLEKIDLPAAMDLVLDGYVGGDPITTLVPVLSQQRQRVERLPTIPWPLGVEMVTNVPMHAAGIEYLARRGVDLATAQEWKLGVGRNGRLANYVVFPVYMDGGLVYWQGRAMYEPPPAPPELVDPAQRKAWTKDWIKANHYQKSRNPIDLGAHASASEALLNYDRARMSPHVVICEGPFDAIKVGDHAVALLGKVAQQAKIERLLRMRAQRYTVYLDRGVQERAHAERLAEELRHYAPTFIATPPEGYDPGSLSREQNAWVVDHAERWTGAQLRAL